MDFFTAVRERRSCRQYLPESVPAGVIDAAIDAALLAPNSSNMQAWEFFWVRSAEPKSKLVTACLSQPAAKTAAELVVVTCRQDVWRRNQKLMLAHFAQDPGGSNAKARDDYYKKIVPLVYTQGFLGIIGIAKKIMFTLMGFWQPVPRGPCSITEVREMNVKSTALACQSFMLAITAQGYASCPMEGFDEVRVKKILGLGRASRVVMVISVGKADPRGIWGERLRFDRKLFVKEV